MPQIFYVPYARYTLESNLPKEEVITNLQNRIIKPKMFNYMTWSQNNLFLGKSDPKSGRFRIRKQTDHRNSFNPIIYGIIKATPTGSRITLELRLPTIAYVFLAIWCIIALTMGVAFSRELHHLLIPMAAVTFLYIISFFGFNIGAATALDSLHKIT